MKIICPMQTTDSWSHFFEDSKMCNLGLVYMLASDCWAFLARIRCILCSSRQDWFIDMWFWINSTYISNSKTYIIWMWYLQYIISYTTYDWFSESNTTSVSVCCFVKSVFKQKTDFLFYSDKAKNKESSRHTLSQRGQSPFL